MALHDPLSSSVAVTVMGIILATGVVWLGSRLMEANIEQLAEQHEVAPSIREAIVLPAASSTPELLTVVVAGLWGAFGIGVGTVLGSAIFNVLVIPAFVGIVSPGVIDSDRPAVYLEILWYLIAILALTLVVVLAYLYQGPGLGGDAFAVEVGWAVGLLLPLLYAVHYVLHRSAASAGGRPVADGGVSGTSWRPVARFVVGAVVLTTGIAALVWTVRELSTPSQVSAFLMGATYLAAATSVPDLLVLLQSRSAGAETAGLTHVLGSNTFDILVGIPAGILLLSAVPSLAPATISVGGVVPLIAVLTLATLLLFAVLRTDLELTTNESYLLLGAYMGFIVLAVAEMVGRTAFLPGL